MTICAAVPHLFTIVSMSLSPALPPKVIQGAITANGQLLAAGNSRASTVGVQIAAQVIPQPSAPTLSAGSGDSTLAGGTYQVKITYVNQYGESQVSSASSITITAAQTIIVSAPPLAGNATGWNIYMTQVNGATFTLQNASPIPLGVYRATGPSTYTFSAPPTSTGAAPPSAPAWTGTISFQASIDGQNLVPITLTAVTGSGGTSGSSTTTSGMWTGTFSGLVFFQAIATAAITGQAIVTISLQEA